MVASYTRQIEYFIEDKALSVALFPTHGNKGYLVGSVPLKQSEAVVINFKLSFDVIIVDEPYQSPFALSRFVTIDAYAPV